GWSTRADWTSIVPIREASGQAGWLPFGTAVALSIPIWAEEQPARPLAPEGLTTRPSGRVTSALRRFDVARWLSEVVCGTSRSTSRPLGESAVFVVGRAFSVGLNCTPAQPVVPTSLPLASRITSERLAGGPS